MLALNWLPVFINERVEDLPACAVGVHQRAHRIDDLHAGFWRSTTPCGKGDVPAQRVTGHRANVMAAKRGLCVQIAARIDQG